MKKVLKVIGGAIGSAIVLALVLIVVAGIISAFQAPRLTAGEVYDKRYEPSRSELKYMPSFVFGSDSMTTIMMPQNVYVPEKYILCVRDWDNEKQEYITKDFYTQEDVWSRTSIGDWYDSEEDT